MVTGQSEVCMGENSGCTEAPLPLKNAVAHHQPRVQHTRMHGGPPCAPTLKLPTSFLSRHFLWTAFVSTAPTNRWPFAGVFGRSVRGEGSSSKHDGERSECPPPPSFFFVNRLKLRYSGAHKKTNANSARPFFVSRGVPCPSRASSARLHPTRTAM